METLGTLPWVDFDCLSDTDLDIRRDFDLVVSDPDGQGHLKDLLGGPVVERVERDLGHEVDPTEQPSCSSRLGFGEEFVFSVAGAFKDGAKLGAQLVELGGVEEIFDDDTAVAVDHVDDLVDCCCRGQGGEVIGHGCH